MEEKNKEQMLAVQKIMEENFKRPLKPQELEELRMQYDNPVATHVALRPKEIDLKMLSGKEYRQLEDRNIRDLLAYDKYITGLLSDISCYLCIIAKKMGIEDPTKEAQKFSMELLENEKKKGQ